jgi:AraC-like DNA-binding protein
MQRIIDRSMAYSPVASMEICLAITGLLTGMAKSACADTPPGTGAQKLIREADAFIHLNYQHNISVEDMGRFLHLSPYHLIRIFKKYTGYSPHEYLNIVRINRAADLLCESDLRVHEVAEKVGFGSVNSFIRNFKKQKGVPPAKFRERK